MNKPCFSRNFFLIDWHHKRLKNTIDLLLFYGEHFYGLLESEMVSFKGYVIPIYLVYIWSRFKK